MNLLAYMQIDKYSEIAKRNGIDVPRLRGYSLMSEEELVSREDIEAMTSRDIMWEAEEWCCSRFGASDLVEYSSRTDIVRKRYLEFDDIKNVVGIRWDRIHGKKRRTLKRMIRAVKHKAANQYSVFNKYVGRDDVLQIHARIGGKNWEYYGGKELEKQPWFLERADDHFDGTYCDIYALITQ